MGYKINGVSPPIGADQAAIKAGDTVLWYWTAFTPQGGSPTLLLKRRAARNCYWVLSQNDLGQTTPATGATLHVDGRRVATRSGRGCVGKHRGLVRATAQGAVRSNALQVRRASLAALALVLLLPGCGHERAGSGSASLWITRDRGQTVVLVATVPAGLTAMDALDRKADVAKRYGGRYVQSIDGVEGDISKRRDWFWFLNGSRPTGARPTTGCVPATSSGGTSAPGAARCASPSSSAPFRSRSCTAGTEGSARSPFAMRPARRRAHGRSGGSSTRARCSLFPSRRPDGANVFLVESGRRAFTASLGDSGGAADSPVQFVFAGDAAELARNPARFRFRYSVP